MTKQDIIMKIHLIISVIIVVPVAILYGFFPDALLELSPETLDEQNFNKAVMGIYVAFSTLWTAALFNKSYLKTALISNVLFMLGLAFGRLMSVLVDGVPSNRYAFGLFGELLLGIYGLWVLKSQFGNHNIKKH
ncbi:DUF4345 domain-containing protein [Psychroserpens sp.]|uniref:DUF4345 domain-containing protein n=1 Tax=Psychroserpens sp. TaxID=2020870 RepID=UPI001B18BE35|nr:DUF4345 domain-containing protein [Psychroserpens sp.]MBO6605323.1 DUF4345 domain-containing protein [Psychroserpens sp.]MBO6629994.1 DUF4345 domain-containing protein [Psychroserpens sp.]MBO6653868.1 DUF4345 domain-containing protein [Psychroserpens sp.]MBO6682189.1 DUF4345 domain-containing protein [Psychroserpens sp.]MBO6748697.1 DUF4345 domain-containing protein [Psychroserpens sp.]